jgi:hypothetical protein
VLTFVSSPSNTLNQHTSSDWFTDGLFMPARFEAANEEKREESG